MEILAEKTVEVIGHSGTVIGAIFICVAIFLLSAIIGGICSTDANDYYTSKATDNVIIVCAILAFISVVTMFALIICGSRPLEQYQEYKVVFKENIDMNEFLENYEIVSLEDNIVTIKDKEHTPIIK